MFLAKLAVFKPLLLNRCAGEDNSRGQHSAVCGDTLQDGGPLSVSKLHSINTASHSHLYIEQEPPNKETILFVFQFFTFQYSILPLKRLSAVAGAHSKGISVRTATRQYGVSRTTLQSHLDGGQTVSEALEKRQNLSPTLEAKLVRWVKQRTKLGFALPHSRSQMYTTRIFKAFGSPQTLGTH